jgi:hypothetical protein
LTRTRLKRNHHLRTTSEFHPKHKTRTLLTMEQHPINPYTDPNNPYFSLYYTHPEYIPRVQMIPHLAGEYQRHDPSLDFGVASALARRDLDAAEFAYGDNEGVAEDVSIHEGVDVGAEFGIVDGSTSMVRQGAMCPCGGAVNEMGVCEGEGYGRYEDVRAGSR